MKLLKNISDFLIRFYEVIVVLISLCIMLVEDRPFFEWVVFLLLTGVIMAVMKLRNCICKKS